MEFEISIKQVRDTCQPTREVGIQAIDCISGVATLTEAVSGDLSFLSSHKHRSELASTKASVVIVPEDTEQEPKKGQLFLYSKNPSLGIAKVCEIVSAKMWIRKPAGVHASVSIAEGAAVDPTAFIGANCVIDDAAKIGANVQVLSGTFIGEGVTIGDDSVIGPNVTLLRDTVVGNRVRIHPGVVLGSDGFGYEPTSTGIYKVPQVGRVELGDDVEIGSNTTIDRGRLGATYIGAGTKIDNQVQIGHNVKVGQFCILCAQVGIAGSTEIGDFVVMGGRSGASGHLKIGRGAQLAGCSVAFSDLDAGGKYGGSPAVSLMAFHRITAITQRLPDMFKRMKKLESLANKS